MNQAIVSEEEFIELHDRIHAQGQRIIRCIEFSGTVEGRRFQLVWI